MSMRQDEISVGHGRHGEGDLHCSGTAAVADAACCCLILFLLLHRRRGPSPSLGLPNHPPSSIESPPPPTSPSPSLPSLPSIPPFPFPIPVILRSFPVTIRWGTSSPLSPLGSNQITGIPLLVSALGSQVFQQYLAKGLDNSMSQPDIGKVVAQKWEAVKVQSLQSLEAGCQAWATYVDPKAHELQVNLKQKMEETKRFLSEKAFSFTNHK
ncbi:uncharacterized protein [Physcomitrium patens]|uniref:uncharacterized protein n=1 Tax=Physcomitrium patens TaxID=3218 RepID=UPI003CCDE0B1